ncbi:MAG: gliding motility protein GldL [Bacteroidetes bacterium]|nr:MAG: gliding motility protein GldL [Bacteroidota bacterium]
MGKFEDFLVTKSFKNIMAKLYGIGAAVVIAGALFKILHWPGANLMLIVGMGTEVLIFFVSAFEPIHMDLDWTLVYPELAGMHDEHGKEDKKSITEQLDNMLEEAKIGPELIASLGSGLQNLSEQTGKMSTLADATVATNEFTTNIKSASQKIGGLSAAYDKASTSIGSSISDLEKASGKTSQALDLITNSTQQQAGTYSEQLQKVSKNLGSLNGAYELQLQNSNENIKAASKANEGIQKLLTTLEASMQASQHEAASYGEHLKKSAGNVQSLNTAYELQLQTLGKANSAYQNFEKAMASLGETTDDARKFKQQLAAMSENLSSLNTVYGNMLTAMSPLKK